MEGQSEESRTQKIWREAKRIENLKAGKTVAVGSEDATPQKEKPAMTEEKLNELLQRILSGRAQENTVPSTLAADMKSTKAALRPGRRPHWSGRLGK